MSRISLRASRSRVWTLSACPWGVGAEHGDEHELARETVWNAHLAEGLNDRVDARGGERGDIAGA